MMMNISPVAFLDTNILVYNHQGESKHNESSRKLLSACFNGEVVSYISPQILLEFFAVITSPRRVTNPLSSESAIEKVEEYLKSETILKLYQNEKTINTTVELVKRYKPSQQNIFDLHIVATMLSHGITHIYTFNEKDFDVFSEITAINPDTIWTAGNPQST